MGCGAGARACCCCNARLLLLLPSRGPCLTASASVLGCQAPETLAALLPAGLCRSDLAACMLLLALGPRLELGKLLASSGSLEARGWPRVAVPAVLGVSGGPGGKNAADIESSAASGRLRTLIGGGGAGSAVEVPGRACCSGAGAAAWSAAALAAEAAAGRLRMAGPAAGKAAAEAAGGGCTRSRKSALSTEVDRGGRRLVAAAL